MPTDSVIGAEVRGVSLAEVPDDATRQAVERALERHGVLIFRDQAIEPAQQIAWSKAFAHLEPTARIDARLEGHPEIFVVGNTGEKMSPSPRRTGRAGMARRSHAPGKAGPRLDALLRRDPAGRRRDAVCLHVPLRRPRPRPGRGRGADRAAFRQQLQNFLRTRGEKGAADGLCQPRGAGRQVAAGRRHP